MSNRAAALIAGAILLAALLVVGALFVLKDDPCEAWQKDMLAWAEEWQEVAASDPELPAYLPQQQAHNADVLRLAEDADRLEDDRPAGCEDPEIQP